MPICVRLTKRPPLINYPGNVIAFWDYQITGVLVLSGGVANNEVLRGRLKIVCEEQKVRFLPADKNIQEIMPP